MSDSNDTPKPRKPRKPPKATVHYTPELADEICAHVAIGDLSLTKLCEQPGMPTLRAVLQWLAANEDFARKMVQARELRADRHRDKIEDIIAQVNDGKVDPQGGRVMIDGLRWLAGIERPAKYGDKLRVQAEISKGPDLDEGTSRQWIEKMLAATRVAGAAPTGIPLLPHKDEAK